MGVTVAPTEQGKEAARKLRKETRKEEEKVEARMGHDLKKGGERFEERSRSSDGKSAGTKQDL